MQATVAFTLYYSLEMVHDLLTGAAACCCLIISAGVLCRNSLGLCAPLTVFTW